VVSIKDIPLSVTAQQLQECLGGCPWTGWCRGSGSGATWIGSRPSHSHRPPSHSHRWGHCHRHRWRSSQRPTENQRPRAAQPGGEAPGVAVPGRGHRQVPAPQGCGGPGGVRAGAGPAAGPGPPRGCASSPPRPAAAPRGVAAVSSATLELGFFRGPWTFAPCGARAPAAWGWSSPSRRRSAASASWSASTWCTGGSAPGLEGCNAPAPSPAPACDPREGQWVQWERRRGRGRGAGVAEGARAEGAVLGGSGPTPSPPSSVSTAATSC